MLPVWSRGLVALDPFAQTGGQPLAIFIAECKPLTGLPKGNNGFIALFFVVRGGGLSFQPGHKRPLQIGMSRRFLKLFGALSASGFVCGQSVGDRVKFSNPSCAQGHGERSVLLVHFLSQGGFLAAPVAEIPFGFGCFFRLHRQCPQRLWIIGQAVCSCLVRGGCPALADIANLKLHFALGLPCCGQFVLRL